MNTEPPTSFRTPWRSAGKSVRGPAISMSDPACDLELTTQTPDHPGLVGHNSAPANSATLWTKCPISFYWHGYRYALEGCVGATLVSASVERLWSASWRESVLNGSKCSALCHSLQGSPAKCLMHQRALPRKGAHHTRPLEARHLRTGIILTNHSTRLEGFALRPSPEVGMKLAAARQE